VDMDMLSSVRGHFNTCEQDFYANHAAANRYALPGLGVHAYLETDAGWAGDPTDETRSSTLNPMVQLWGLVTHRQLQDCDLPCTPDDWIDSPRNTITVGQALRMMTYEPAYAVSQEQVLGSLEPGKFADLVILSGNPMTVDPDQLRTLKTWMTMVGGQVRYCLAGHEALCPGWQPEPEDTRPEPVTLRLIQPQHVVQTGTPIQLTIGWLADTKGQVQSFLDSIDLTGRLDGQPLTDLNNYWGKIEPVCDHEEQGADYLSTWSYPLAHLDAGTHIIEIKGTLNEPVTDGFNPDNNDSPDEYSGVVWTYKTTIVVREHQWP
jgi:hypothetical protein